MLKFKDVKSEKTPDVFVFSDPHYNHKNICRWISAWTGDKLHEKTRNYYTLDEMNTAILSGINKNVKPDDVLICLGDWSFGGFDSVIEFFDEINCKNIHLILSENDSLIEKENNSLKFNFESLSYADRMIIDRENFMLSHYPMSIWPKEHYHLHGYLHSKPGAHIFENRMDVGLDGHIEFRPYHVMDEIIPLFKEKKLSES